MISIGLTVVLDSESKDVFLNLADDASSDAVLRAIAASVGIDGSTVRLRNQRTGRLIGDPVRSTQFDLRHGDTLRAEPSGASIESLPPVRLRRVGSGHGDRVLSIVDGETRVGRVVDGPRTLRLDDPTVSSAHATLLVSNDGIEVIDHDSTNGTWVNGEAVHKSRHLAHGDIVRFGDSSSFTVDAPSTRGSGSHLTEADGYLVFNRPPRRMQPNPGRTVSLPLPPTAPPDRRLPVPMMVVPVVMGLAIFIFTRNAMFLLFAGMGPLMAGWNWYEERRSGRGRFRSEANAYRSHLGQTRQDLIAGRAASIRWRADRLPDVGALTGRALGLSDELWDRRPSDDDFLDVRVGIADQPALLRVEIDERGDPDLVSSARQLAADFAKDPRSPVSLSLQPSGVIGIAGMETTRRRTARWIVTQIACRNSPRDLAMTVLAPSGLGAWEWMKWLPHSAAAHEWLAAEAGGSVDELVDSLLSLAAQRSAAAHPEAPRLLVVVEAGLELSEQSKTALIRAANDRSTGTILMWMATDRSQLPGECEITLEMQANDRLRLHMGSVEYPPVDSAADGISVDDSAAIARAVAPLRDPRAASRVAGLPARVGLLELLGIQRDVPEAIVELWSGHDGGLRAPIGIDESGSVRMIDLQSTGDGPHGLIAGTTGAGKSELLQSLVATLASRYPPSHLTFLFVDYKGGSAFKDCVRLPHCVGLLTNLDEGLADRARRSLQAELVRRQRLFKDHGAKDLDDLRSKAPDVAPPALLIVFDEFASLVDDVPEFIDGVVDIAEKGRSLGVHMILATQTPGGAINRKIQNCVNFRVALRLKEESESVDVVKSSDAVGIPSEIPGRGLIRLGSGDLLRFQGAYAGGVSARDHLPSASARTLLFTGPRPGSDAVLHGHEETDLSLLVDGTVSAARVLAVPPPARPWLDELPQQLRLDDVIDTYPRGLARVPVGLIDLPDQQRQEPFALDFAALSNVLVIGGAGMGKTTLLRTIAAAGAMTHTTDDLHIYGLDFAGRGLSVVQSLAHVGGIARAGEPSRVRSLIAMIAALISDRRRQMETAGSIDVVRQRGGTMAITVVLVDGLPSLLAELEELDGGVHLDAFAQLIADGPGVGIHFVLATDQPQRVPMGIANSVAERLVLPLPNPDAYYAAGIDRPPAASVKPGRAVSASRGAEVQIAVAVDHGVTSDGGAQARYLADLAARTEQTTAPVPAIEVLPDVVLPQHVMDGTPPEAVIPIGLDDVTLQPQLVDFNRIPTLLIMGPDLSGRSSALAWINRAMRANAAVKSVLISPRRTDAVRSEEWDVVYHSALEGIEELESLAQASEDRDDNRWTLIGLDDCDDLLEAPMGGPPEERQQYQRQALALDQIIRQARDQRYVIAATGTFSSLSRSQGWPRRMLQNQQAVILSPASLAVGYIDPVFNVRLPRRSDYRPTPGRAVLVRRGDADLIQCVLVD